MGDQQQRRQQQQQRRHHHQHRPGADTPAPAETEPLPCPRCESINTKFCYYNNYNLSQPRYFCKSCRRYWTQGGTLRNIPVGGGTRRNAKRSRPCTPATHITTSATTSTSTSTSTTPTPTPTPTSSALTINSIGKGGGGGSDHVLFNGSFTSLLNSQAGGCGFWGLDEMGMGLGLLGQRRSAGVWPWMDFGGSLQIGGGGVTAHAVDGGFVDGVVDCFSWPELAISTAPTEGAALN
ncbi:hypothetical protein Sjap_010137 [Stephania japonica]|uniref:Dof zinc finger protein n=1 Tax=Stephania japonica TaxID=461633 RepID=A0AAP0J9U2_9MAGN